MKLVHRTRKDSPETLAILSGSFHPITQAHLALAEAALQHVEEVLFVMPQRFPHKEYGDVPLEKRLSIVKAAVAGEARFSVAVSEGGLFLEMAREARELWRNVGQIWFPCGKDAAERILTWDYGRVGAVEEMLCEFGLLVADRRGSLEITASNVVRLELPRGYDEVSATEVRERIKKKARWEELVPATALDLIRECYLRGNEG